MELVGTALVNHTQQIVVSGSCLRGQFNLNPDRMIVVGTLERASKS